MGIFGKQIGNPTASGVGLPVGTRVYRALLTQTGTDAPVATVLENTLGGTVVWTRSGAGDYQGTLSGAFTANKTVLNSGRGKIAMEGSSTYLFLVGLQRVSNNVVSLFTTRLDVTDLGPGASSQDEILGGDPESPSMVEILVYP